MTDADLASAVGSGDVPVLATPTLIAWFEAATVAAVRDQLEDGTTTVGMRVRIDHVAPTTAGATVRARATLVEVDGRRLTFEVSAAERDDGPEVATGKITRVIVDRERFLARL